VETYTLEICDDCATWHANADDSGMCECAEAPDATGACECEATAVRQAPGLGGLHLALTCDPDEGTCDSFSWRPCDACRRRYGGSRHPATAWEV
jgi:hypothetical protein